MEMIDTPSIASAAHVSAMIPLLYEPTKAFR